MVVFNKPDTLKVYPVMKLVHGFTSKSIFQTLRPPAGICVLVWVKGCYTDWSGIGPMNVGGFVLLHQVPGFQKTSACDGFSRPSRLPISQCLRLAHGLLCAVSPSTTVVLLKGSYQVSRSNQLAPR